MWIVVIPGVYVISMHCLLLKLISLYFLILSFYWEKRITNIKHYSPTGKGLVKFFTNVPAKLSPQTDCIRNRGTYNQTKYCGKNIY